MKALDFGDIFWYTYSSEKTKPVELPPPFFPSYFMLSSVRAQKTNHHVPSDCHVDTLFGI